MTDSPLARSDDDRLDEALRETFPASDAFALAPASRHSSRPRPAQIAHLNRIVASLFALYVATKGCHWHVGGPHFRDHHLLLDAQAAEILAAVDPLAERVRKLGAGTISSVWDIETHATRRYPPLCDAVEMLTWLLDENRVLVDLLREAHGLSGRAGDNVTAALLDAAIGEAEGRIWFLFEATRTQAC